ncbi:MAG: D-tyrosyl-tRNA(Tyr) deacylase [Candidatus Fluviicola riflensis]|nr:MAG: D-tyrosyl-tRNA(Tyr) deacylase [Candidatus Fluviicola riflensis]OGS76868.1 MAG: D-tyrosyl-tRNA(Tyr) deacylase [Candidatus Fluviicola riflensis]OGS81798.1 MAG: D-tyrosyl-tRNA(Tyr) deacylase [Fluviicola sp. RIFCSPHIGHO2_01_FULL_43_53]OGS88597.1 MAG: D-tyrosyl-tRNA(Tyr) deacylase [Fluviicola sp. RIFCSPHIGHO2_12_FULL_43_24]
MRLVIQRVSEASVTIDGNVRGVIGKGFLILIGIESTDTQDDVEWLVQKTVNMRIFSDDEGKMNLSLNDVSGELLVISQFTLHASTKKGNRPSFIQAARPETAVPLYESFVKGCKLAGINNVETGIFGADMKVALINDGPVTIVIDSKERN